MGKKRTRSEPCNAEDCGETLTLAIVDEFQKLYEKKLAEIDESCDDEHSKEQEKICTLRAWVSDLTEQNKMLVQAVEELEEEASDTVVTLENKLKDSTQKVYNRMSDAYEFYSKQQNELVDHLRNDICNLIEVIRRCREEGRLNADDLTFFEVTCKDVYGDSESSNQILRLNEDASELCSKLEKSEKERLNLQIEFENCTAKLQDKIQENENLISELFKLQKSTQDMREALTAEVADKHDSIRALRRENQNLEEQCRQIDKQAHFKDDIIKELRKELRAVKKCELRESTVNKMFDYRKYLMVIKNELKNLRNLIKRSQEYENERENRVSLVNKSVEEINQTFANIKHELYNLESISSQTTSANSEIEHHIKKIHEVIMNSLTNLSQLNSFESINKVVGEIKAMDILYKEQGKNLVLQEIYMNKVKRTFNQTAADILRLQAMLDNFLQENYQIDSKISETQREMHRVQKDLFNTYTKIVKDFKIFNELSDDVLEVCDKNESDYDINEIRLITDQSNMVTHTKTETGDFNSDAGVNTDGNCEMIIDQLQSELNKCKLEKQGLEKMIETCTEKLKKAQIDVSLLEDINEDLHDICNNSNEDTDQGVLIHDLTDMIENYQRKICSLECALQSKDAIIENLQKAVQLHQSTINELKKQCEESQGNNENLQQLVEHLQESLCTVKCQLNDVESKRLKEINYLNNSLYSLQFDLNCFEDIYLILWNSLIQYYQNDFRLRETIFDLEVRNFNLQQDVVILQIQMRNSTNNFRLIWKNSSLQREIALLKTKLCAAEDDCCQKIQEVMLLKNENDCKNKFINSIIEIIEYSNEKPCITLNNYEELIPNLKRIIVALHDLTKRTNEQDQIISELRNQICDYQHLENYIQKIANVNNQIESKNYDCNEAIEQVSSDSKGDTISLFSDLLNYNENDLKSIKCSSSIMSLQSIVVRLEMSQKTFENLQKRLNDCKCDEYYKEIQRLQDENMNLRKITDNGILTRETFLKLYDELSNEMAETKTYLQYLQDLLKHDTYTDDLEAKNCTLSSTILEMEKCIECLKLELAEFTNKANTDETTSNQCIENLETLLKEKELEVNCVRTQLLTKECNITRLETVNKSLTDKITQLQERLETVNNDLTDKITQMQKLEACNQELMDKITQLQDHCTKTYEKQCIYENLIDKTVSEMCDCKQTYETIQEKAEWLRQCLTHKFSEISEMQKNSQVCNETISLLRKQLSEEKQKYYEDMEKVSSTNEKLKNHLTKFINTYGKSETQLQQSQSASQLDVCLKIISELRNEKSALEADNIALTEEISRLNTELYERCQENTSKQQKIDNLEKEMIELDKSRNELRAESKQVLENVRNWIQEQRQMNSILNENMSQKCAALERFKKERLNLLNDIDMLKQTNRQLISENSLLKRKLCLCGPPPALKLQHEFDESPCKMFNSSISSLDTTSISTSENQSIICIPPHSHPHCHDPNLKFM